MGIFLGSGREKRLSPTFAEPVVPPFLGAFGGFSSRSSDSALAVPTVWACVSLLANAVSMLPLETFRKTADIPARVTNPPLLVNPCGDMTQSEWLHMLMVSLLMRGNAYGHITQRDSYQRATQIELLSPDTVHVDVDRDTGAITYKIGTDRKKVPTVDIWHVRGLTMPGSRIGLSPITYAASVLGVELASRDFASDFFNGGGTPKAVVMSDQLINQEQARTIKDRMLAGTRNREPMVLGAGLKYVPISVLPEESQFLATQHANVGQIARFFNVPAGMVGGPEGGSMQYSNMEQRGIDFLTYACGFWLKRIEDAIFPLLPAPQYVAFNTNALLRTDAETAAKVDVQLIAGKIMTPSEVRQVRNMRPMTPEQLAEADLVPLTITPMGGAKAALSTSTNAPVDSALVPVGEQQNSLALGLSTLAAATHRSGSEMAAAVASLADSVMTRQARTVTKTIQRDEHGHLESVTEKES